MAADGIRSDYTLTFVCIGLSIVVFSPIIVFYKHNKRYSPYTTHGFLWTIGSSFLHP
jgi:hypothetical protein